MHVYVCVYTVLGITRWGSSVALTLPDSISHTGTVQNGGSSNMLIVWDTLIYMYTLPVHYKSFDLSICHTEVHRDVALFGTLRGRVILISSVYLSLRVPVIRPSTVFASIAIDGPRALQSLPTYYFSAGFIGRHFQHWSSTTALCFTASKSRQCWEASLPSDTSWWLGTTADRVNITLKITWHHNFHSLCLFHLNCIVSKAPSTSLSHFTSQYGDFTQCIWNFHTLCRPRHFPLECVGLWYNYEYSQNLLLVWC